jgi:CRISPR/Cas system-associated exonuclease Cas4 (RecB family)
MQDLRLSPTSVVDFLHCQRYFYYSRILKLPQKQTGRMVVGRVIHRTLSLAYKRMFSGEMMPFGEVMGLVDKVWDFELRRETVWDSDPDAMKGMAKQLVEIYYHELMPRYIPTASEQKYQTNLAVDYDPVTDKTISVSYVGFIDLEVKPNLFDDEPRIAEIKIRKRRIPQKEADKDLQISSYGLLKGVPIVAEFHVGLMQKKPKWEVVQTKRGQQDYDFLTDMVKQTYNLITKAGEFLPNTTWWGCNEYDEETGSGCQFWTLCHIL